MKMENQREKAKKKVKNLNFQFFAAIKLYHIFMSPKSNILSDIRILSDV